MSELADGQKLRRGLGNSHSNKRLPSWKQGASSLVMELGRYSNVGGPQPSQFEPSNARRLGLADRSLDRANGAAFFQSR